MGICAGRPDRNKGVRRARAAHPHQGDPALTRDERRRFEEIARRIHQDELPIAPTTTVIPARLAALGLFVVGATGVLIGLARSDVVVLTVIGIVPAASAMLLIALARARCPATASAAASPLKRFWSWLTTCAEDGCGNHPVHLGWCGEHAPGHDPAPDEYWGDEYRGDK
jgi:hypothetical protein